MNKPLTQKRRTREHVIADLSVSFVWRQVLPCGHTVERVRADYGYDLFMLTYTADGEIENGDIRIPLKATDSVRLSKDGPNVTLRVSRSDLLLRVFERMPVMLPREAAQKETRAA